MLKDLRNGDFGYYKDKANILIVVDTPKGKFFVNNCLICDSEITLSQANEFVLLGNIFDKVKRIL